jgi:hypothetical protein
MSFIYSFLIGCCVGAWGLYYWQQYHNNNQYSGSGQTKKDNQMTYLFEQFPYLMNLIKSNVNDPEYRNIREFFVVDPLAIMNSSIPRLRYDLSEEMLSLLSTLEKLSYIERLEHASLLYRISEDFVIHLKSPPKCDSAQSQSNTLQRLG